MPSHQARRKPLPKDYQFPTPQTFAGDQFFVPVGESIVPVRYHWHLQPGSGLSRLITRTRVLDDDGDGYGHAV